MNIYINKCKQMFSNKAKHSRMDVITATGVWLRRLLGRLVVATTKSQFHITHHDSTVVTDLIRCCYFFPCSCLVIFVMPVTVLK